MSFIAKNPLSAPKMNSSPPSPMEGARGLYPKSDGWYDIDDNGDKYKLLEKDDALMLFPKYICDEENDTYVYTSVSALDAAATGAKNGDWGIVTDNVSNPNYYDVYVYDESVIELSYVGAKWKIKYHLSAYDYDISVITSNLGTAVDNGVRLSRIIDDTIESGLQEKISGKSDATNLQNGSATGSLKSVGSNSVYTPGIYSFSAGGNTEATGDGSVAFGFSSKAQGAYSSALGYATKATGDKQTVIGSFNATDANKAFIIGNGNLQTLHASNAYTLDWNGNGWFAGKVTVGENGEELITVSDALENLCPHTTVSAENSESLTITDGLSGTKLKECTVYGTEEGVGDYNSTTQKYDIPITVRGKNLLHYVGGATPPAYNILTCDGSECVLNGTANSNIAVNYSENYNIHLSAGAYRFSFIPVSGSLVNRNNAYDEFYVGLRKRNTAWLTSTGGLKHTTYSAKQTLSFTLQEDVDCSFALVGKGVADNYTFRVQLEKGSSATEYEPYTAPQSVTLSLDAPLYEGESASLSEGGERLTLLPVTTNIIEIGTAETPSEISASYYQDINTVIANNYTELQAQIDAIAINN